MEGWIELLLRKSDAPKLTSAAGICISDYQVDGGRLPVEEFEGAMDVLYMYTQPDCLLKRALKSGDIIALHVQHPRPGSAGFLVASPRELPKFARPGGSYDSSPMCDLILIQLDKKFPALT